MSLLGRARAVTLSPRSLAAAAVLLGCVGLRFAFFGGGAPHIVTVDFADADGLVNGNEVRIAGVEAGTVHSIQIVHPATSGGAAQYAEVQLEINDAHWPLRQGTQFAVRPKGVLSNVFVALTPGASANAAMSTSAPIPVSQTSSPISLDELNNVFNPSVRDSIKTQIAQGNVMLGDDAGQNGAANLNGLLVNLNPLSSELAPLTAVLGQRSPELGRLNTEYDTILGDLAREDQNLRGVIQNGDVLFAAIAAKQTDLQGTLDHAASVFTKLDQVLTGEENNLTLIMQKGPASLDKTVQSTSLLVPLLTSVNPHIPDLNKLLHYFVTANGFNVNGVQSLRVDTSLPISGRSASACGGEPKEQPTCSVAFASTPANGGTGPVIASSTGSQLPAVLQGLLG